MAAGNGNFWQTCKLQGSPNGYKHWQLLAEMRTGKGIQPNVITYSVAISACEKSKGKWQAALKLLTEMSF